MASISTIGVGSGLELSALIQQLVDAEREPKEVRLNLKEANLQAELSAFGTLKSSLSSLQGSLTSLSKMAAGHTATSSNEDVLTVSASSIADVGSYNIEVSRIAASHALATQAYSSPSDVVGSGILQFSFGTTDYDPVDDLYNDFTPNPDKSAQSITIDSENNTLEGIRDAVNEANIGVDAVIVNDGSGFRLLFNSEDSGATNSLQVSVSGDEGGNLSDLAFNATTRNLEQTVEASDALLNVNGLAITSRSNSLSEAIHGVDIELQNASEGENVKVSIGLDKEAIGVAVDEFVAQYNELMNQVKSLTSYNLESQEAAVFLGDSSVMQLESQLRNGLVDKIQGESTAAYRFLLDIGISTDINGQLSVDTDKFDAAMEENFDAVVSLVQGLGSTLDETVSGFIASDGVIKTRTEGLQARIADISDQRLTLERRIEAMQARYVKQFSALDTLLGELQNTSNFLTQQLENFSNSGKK